MLKSKPLFKSLHSAYSLDEFLAFLGGLGIFDYK